MGQEFIFVTLLGLALGIGKVLERLTFKDMVKVLGLTGAALLLVGAVYCWLAGIPFGMMLIWLVACIMLGVFSSRMIQA